MGAINSAFNQAAGAVAGASIAIKHAKETDESKVNVAENSALIARNQARLSSVEAKEADEDLANKISKAEQDRDEARAEFVKAMKRKNGSQKTKNKRFTEVQAAEEALSRLKEKRLGIAFMMDKASEQIKQAEKATKLAEEKKLKFQSRWGGIK